MAAPERIRLGHEAKLYYGTAWLGTEVDARSAGSTFTEIKTVSNVTVSRTDERVDVTSRRQGGKKASDKGLEEWMVECDLNIHKLEAVAIAMEDAFEAGTVLYIMALNGARATVGARGVVFPAQVVNWVESQPIDGKITVDGLRFEYADGEFQGIPVVMA